MKYIPLLVAAAALASASACDSATSTAATTREPPPAAESAPSCPAADFAGFLRAFASDDRVRQAHTAPVVIVTDWVDAGVLEPVEETTSVPKEKYQGFSLEFANGAYYHLDIDGKRYGDPVQVSVSPRGTNVEVRYISGMSEGNSWLFARNKDCWQLVSDPEPTWD